jgi:hypothetical protein
MEHLKDKINEFKSNSKNKNIRYLSRGINEFKKVYQPTTNLAKTRGATYLRILIRKNYFCELLNVHGAGGVRQTEMQTAEPFVPEPSASELRLLLES